MTRVVTCGFLACLVPITLAAQPAERASETLPLDEAIRLAIANNRQVQSARLQIEKAEADVQTVGVRPDRQGDGLGRTLVEDLLAEAARRGCTQVLLEVREGNTAARRLYASLGFEEVGLRRGYYGPGADAFVMRLGLPPVGDAADGDRRDDR